MSYELSGHRRRTPRPSSLWVWAPRAQWARRAIVTRRAGFVMPQPVYTLSGLEFSLRPPRWVRKMKPGKVLIKVAKVGAVVAGAAIVAPAAAGLVLRGGAAAIKAAGVVGKIGAGAFRLGAGKSGANLVSSMFRRGPRIRTTLPTQPTVTVTEGPIETPQPPAMPQVMPETPAPGRPPIVDNPAGAPPTAADFIGPEMPATSTAATGAPSGINPALLLGGLVIGGLVLSGRKRAA